MQVHLIDGTYELFRHHFAMPSRLGPEGFEIAAARGVVGSMLNLLEDGATHIAVACDTVVESFRNDMFDGYKTGEGIEPELFAQFPVVEEVLAAAGFTVWSMIEHEADDGLAAGAVMAEADPRVDRVLICTPDKDLGQVVNAGSGGGKIVQFDRRKGVMIDVEGVVEKFGVQPESIPDYLALVGDTADGIPGLKGWGAKSSGVVLAEYTHLEEIPQAAGQWEVTVRGSTKLADTLAENFSAALLYRDLATLVLDAPVSKSVDELEWSGPPDEAAFKEACARVAAPNWPARVAKLLAAR
jgi:5'-3' exonuclease